MVVNIFKSKHSECTHNLKHRHNLSTKPNNSKTGIFLVNLKVLANQFIIHGSDELIPRLMFELVHRASIRILFIQVRFTGNTKTRVNKLKEYPVMESQAVLVCRVSLPWWNDSIVPFFFIGNTGGAELFHGRNIPTQTTIFTEKRVQVRKKVIRNHIKWIV